MIETNENITEDEQDDIEDSGKEVVQETKVYKCICGFETTERGELGHHFLSEGKKEPGQHKSANPDPRSFRTIARRKSKKNGESGDIDKKNKDTPLSSPIVVNRPKSSNNAGNGNNNDSDNVTDNDSEPPEPLEPPEPVIKITHKLTLGIVADMFYQAALSRGYTGTMDDFVMECIIGFHEDMGLRIGLVQIGEEAVEIEGAKCHQN